MVDSAQKTVYVKLMTSLPNQWHFSNQDFPVEYRISPHGKRVSMRYHPLKRTILVTMPKRISKKYVADFIMRHLPEVMVHIDTLPPIVPLMHHNVISVLGEKRRISPYAGITDGNTHLVVMAPPSRVGRACIALLQNMVHAHCEATIAQLWKHPDFATLTRPHITLRDPVSRWGSCGITGGAGRIMLSWRLIFAPVEMLDYVLIHECCHLIHHDHSRAFWALCRLHAPQTDAATKWFRAHGSGLFRYVV